MPTIYTTDAMGIYNGSVEIGIYDRIPPRSSMTAPPAGEFVQLQGNEWVVLEAYPVPPTPAPVFDREAAKQARAKAVENILVTTQAGNTFDGDETSQTRMARAVLVLSTGAAESVPWVLADNTVIQADAAELTEALALAGAEQARLWVL